MGKAIRLGRWSFWWTPETGPCLAKLSSKTQRSIRDAFKGIQCIRPLAHSDIPYVSKVDAKVIRESLHKCAQGFRSEIMSSEVFEKWMEERKQFPSLWFLGYRCKDFDFKFKEELFRHMCVECICHGVKTQGGSGSKWMECHSIHEFVDWILTGNSAPVITEDDVEIACPQNVSVVDADVNPNVEDEYGGKHVSFGDDVVVEYEIDDSICEVVSESGEQVCGMRGIKCTQSFDEHMLTHFPSREDCVVCKEAKRRAAKYVKGSSSGPNCEDPFLVADWMNPRVQASDGSKYCLVIGWVQKDVVLAFPSVVKKGQVARCLDNALKEWGLEKSRFVFHSGNEKVLHAPEVLDYLGKPGSGGIEWNGIPYKSNTNSRAESFVQRVENGARCMLAQSGLPVKMWHCAVEAFCQGQMVTKRVGFRINTSKLVPFGCIGRAALPKGLLFKDKFDSRVTRVCNLGLDRATSGGQRVLFKSANNKYRRSVVLARDIVWEPENFAFGSKECGLDKVSTEQIGESCLNRISPHQAQCDRCDKWRFTMFDVNRNGERQFFCEEVGVTCDVAEDARIYQSFGDGVFGDGEHSDANGRYEFEIEDSTPKDEEEVVVARRAKIAVDSQVNRLFPDNEMDGLSSEQSEKKRATLAAFERLGIRAVNDEDIRSLKQCVQNEVRCEKADRCVARVVTVSVREALKEDNPEKGEWERSMDKEINALIGEFGTLEAVDISEVKSGDQLLPSMIIFTKKSDGRLKSRIVACGNFEKVDSGAAYAGVVSHDVWMQCLVLALSVGQEVFQIDVKNAFLQTERVDSPGYDGDGYGGESSKMQTFLKPPKVCRVGDHMVWRVLKSIYGLKSAPASWKQTLTRYLSEKGFRASRLDDTVWIGENGVKILLYVDDLIVLGEREIAEKFLWELRAKFVCTDWVKLTERTREDPMLFLGHELFVETDNGELSLVINQHIYTQQLLQRFGLEGAKGIRNLRQEEFTREFLWSGNKLNEAEHRWFRGFCGGMSYLSLGTRPDLQSMVGILAEGQAGPTENHIKVAKSVLRYLCFHKNVELRLPITKRGYGETIELKCHYDANFSKERARSGGCIFVDGCLSQWWSRRQKCIVPSTAESELIASACAVKELVGVRNFLQDVWSGISDGNLKFNLQVCGDNMAATLMSQSQSSIRKVRHLSLSDLFVRDVVKDEGIRVSWISTNKSSSDVLTKVLGWVKAVALYPALCLRRYS